jgi:hypothetical protein
MTSAVFAHAGIIPPAKGIYQAHLFNSIAGGFQQPWVGNEYGQTSGPGQGHVEPFLAEKKIHLPGQVFLAGPIGKTAPQPPAMRSSTRMEYPRAGV